MDEKKRQEGLFIDLDWLGLVGIGWDWLGLGLDFRGQKTTRHSVSQLVFLFLYFVFGYLVLLFWFLWGFGRSGQDGGIGGRIATSSMRRCLIWVTPASSITAVVTPTDTLIDNATAINLGVIIYVNIVNYSLFFNFLLCNAYLCIYIKKHISIPYV